MARRLELILARQWCSLLSRPVMLFDHDGVLIFFNEPAEALLGRKFDEMGSMVPAEWHSAFIMEDEDGRKLAGRDTPMAASLREAVPTQKVVTLRGMDGLRRRACITTFPIHGMDRACVGAMSLVHTVS